MKTTKKIIIFTVCIPIMLIGWFFLEVTGVLGIIFPNPLKPEITYAEFPFALEYEVDGKHYKYEDVFICEYKGCALNSGSMEKERQWEGKLKSGNDQITLFENDELEIFTFPTGLADSFAGAMMGDENLAEHVIDTFPSVMHREAWTKEHGKSYSFDGNDELMEKYNIRLISWECAPPIKNTFK